MSDEEKEEFLRVMHQVVRMAPWIKGLIVGSFVIGAWATTMEIRQQTAASEIQKHSDAIAQIGLWRERSDAVMVTSGELSQLDKRLQRTEDRLEALGQQLDRIEARIEARLPAEQRSAGK